MKSPSSKLTLGALAMLLLLAGSLVLAASPETPPAQAPSQPASVQPADPDLAAVPLEAGALLCEPEAHRDLGADLEPLLAPRGQLAASCCMTLCQEICGSEACLCRRCQVLACAI